jgi:hypothetical protein
MPEWVTVLAWVLLVVVGLPVFWSLTGPRGLESGYGNPKRHEVTSVSAFLSVLIILAGRIPRGGGWFAIFLGVLVTVHLVSGLRAWLRDIYRA